MERAMGIEPTSEAWESSRENLKAIELANWRHLVALDWLSSKL